MVYPSSSVRRPDRCFFGLLPADAALGKARMGGCAQGLLQDLLELRFTRLLLGNALANSLALQVAGGQIWVLTKVQSLAIVPG